MTSGGQKARPETPAPSPQRPSSTRARADAKREEKLANVRDQVEDGSLVIRQMTDEERRENPARPPREREKRRSSWK